MTRVKSTIERDRDGWRFRGGKISTFAFATYYDAKRAATTAGYEIDNAGWKHKFLSWNFSHHAIDGYPSWVLDKPVPPRRDRHPAFVKLTHVRGQGDVESTALANAWDDIAEVDFYQRDWTDDGIPFVNAGDTYWSGWWFATPAERDRFVAWAKERSP